MKLAVLCDLLEERWPSMDLVAEQLALHAARLPGVEVACVRPVVPPRFAPAARRSAAGQKLALAVLRYAYYPSLVVRGSRADWYHVADHSYAHLALALPRGRVGIYCHDVDAFRPLWTASASTPARALASVLRRGLRRAVVVFHSTPAVGEEIVERELVRRDRVVLAPYGVASEFRHEPAREASPPAVRAPFVLHVGSLIPRKNPEFLIEWFLGLREARPDLELVQIGGELPGALREKLARAGALGHFHGLRGLSRSELAAYYRAARLVVLPSLAEGFGLPLVEALACGAPVLASDLPVLRQVGGEGVVYAPVGDRESFVRVALRLLVGDGVPPLATRLEVAERYSWSAHASTVVDAYVSRAPRSQNDSATPRRRV